MKLCYDPRCLWHGHETCKPLNRRKVKVPGTNLTLEDAYQRTLEREEALERAGYQVSLSLSLSLSLKLI
jgi:hypothetical protein